MGTIIVSKRISAPAGVVFGALTDFEHLAENIDGIERVEMLTDGPVGVGTRFRETRIMFKKVATEEMEVTAFDAGRSHTLTCESCGCHYSTEIACVPDGDTTEVTMTTTYRPLTFMAKMMSPLGALMSGMVKKCLEKDLEQVRLRLESPAVAQSA